MADTGLVDLAIPPTGNTIVPVATITAHLPPGRGDAVRPFTDPTRSAEDLELLWTLRRSLAARARGDERGGRWRAEDGSEHWLQVRDWDQLRTAIPAVGVGFFGQVLEVDHEPINRLEADLLARGDLHPDLLAYYNVLFPWEQWGNLVVFADRAAVERLNADPVHLAAVARTPRHYASLRLHRIELPDGAAGVADPQLRETLLFDFGEEPPWVALRPAG